MDFNEFQVSNIPPDILDAVGTETVAVQQQDDQITLQARLADRGIAEPWSISKLLSTEMKREFIIDEIFAAGETAVIAGASKSLKTSLATDAALSFATGSPFLGKYAVQQKRVLLFSAESGALTIKETAQRVIQSKDFVTEDQLTDELTISTEWIPQAGHQPDLDLLEAMIGDLGVEVVIFDPTYFMIDGDNQSNQAKQGQELRRLAQVVRDQQATPVFVDHIKLSSQNQKEYAPLELADLSGAGKAAFFRQWLLISRREKFNPDSPVHRLWMNYGGSHGYYGSMAVDVDETRDHNGKRAWNLELFSQAQALEQREEAKEQRKREREDAKHAERSIKAERDRQAMLKAYRDAGANGLTMSKAGQIADVKRYESRKEANSLLETEGYIEPCKTKIDGRKRDGFRFVKDPDKHPLLDVDEVNNSTCTTPTCTRTSSCRTSRPRQ